MGQKKVLNPKAAKRAEALGGNADNKKKTDANAVAAQKAVEQKSKLMDESGVRQAVLDAATVTGVLASQYHSKDVKIEQFSVTLYGKKLVEDTSLELTYGRRYGLLGLNGSGKSTILSAIRAREGVPVPDWINIYHVTAEVAPTDVSALDTVISVLKDEVERLEALSLELVEKDPDSEVLQIIGDKLDKMDPTTFESRAGELLSGLGFTEAQMAKATKDMSGGWRMRVALAQALFVEPLLLLLDEPTNHLDLGACVWLEQHLATYPHCLLLISHSQDFLNGVCNEIMHLTCNGELQYYGGNFDNYVRTRTERETNDMKKYEKEQTDIKHLQEFIRSCGTFSNLRKQADSKQKIIDKMVEAGLTKKPVPDPRYAFRFPDSGVLSPPVCAFQRVAFSYSGDRQDYLYKELEFGIDCDSRIALVGPNGAGKSTLIKLIMGELQPVEGQVQKHSHLRIARYNQHSHEQLDLEKTPLEFFIDLFPDGITGPKGKENVDFEGWRRIVGRFGITGSNQLSKMKTMSGGMKSRVVFCLMSLANPHMLLLDEPTNHLDMECIDSLADAINNFPGGMVLVSHDFRLIGQVAQEIWVCENGVKKWDGDIKSYKMSLVKEQERKKKAASTAYRAKKGA